MPGSVIHFSKESRAALKKQGEDSEAGLTKSQKEAREKIRADLDRQTEESLRAKVKEDAAGVIGRKVLEHHKRKHRAGTRRRRSRRSRKSRKTRRS
jgi:hypothetical protein